MQWKGEVFVDMVLPFGLRSAPLLFTAVADALQWAMESKGVSWLDHYIDDFFTVRDPGSPECTANVGFMRRVLAEASLPTEPDKDEGPATVVGILGMEIDTDKLEIRLPPDKLARLKAALQNWRSRKACKKRELLSLIGSLSHDAKQSGPGDLS